MMLFLQPVEHCFETTSTWSSSVRLSINFMNFEECFIAIPLIPKLLMDWHHFNRLLMLLAAIVLL